MAPQELLVALTGPAGGHGVALNDLVQRLQAANFGLGGQITQGNQRLRVQPRGELESLQALRELRLDQRGTRLSDVATVELRPQRMNYVRQLEGRPSVGVDIYKERAANLVDLSRAVRAELEELADDPALRGVEIEIIDDQGQAVTSSLAGRRARSAWRCRSSSCTRSFATGRRR